MAANISVAEHVQTAVKYAKDPLMSVLLHPVVKPFRYMLYIVTPAETSFKTEEEVPDYVTESFPVFTFLALLEVVICILRGRRTLQINDSISSISAGLISLLPTVLCKGIEMSVYFWIYENFYYFHLPWDSPWTWLLGFLGVDFGYYVAHRIGHEVNFFWATHQTHHSSEYYNLTTALRQSATQKYVAWIWYLPMAIAVPPSAYVVHSQFNLLYQFWIHTEVVDKLGPLEYILNTPSHHRVHHGRNRYCIDKNYGGTLIIWDRLFGTFQEETKEEVIYGLVHPLNSWDMIYVQTSHFQWIWKCFWQADGWRNKVNTLVMGPGWAPGKPRTGDHNDIPEIEYPVQVYNKDVPVWCTVYIILHFILAIIAYILLLTLGKHVGALVLFLSVMFIVYTLSVFGWLYEHKPYAPMLELLRCTMFIIFDLHLGYIGLYTNMTVMLIYAARSVRIFYFISAMIWSFQCFKERRAHKKTD